MNVNSRKFIKDNDKDNITCADRRTTPRACKCKGEISSRNIMYVMYSDL